MRLAGLVLVCALVLVAAASTAAAAVPPFDRTRLYAQDAFAAAIRPYSDALGRNPDDAEARFWLGMAYLYAAHLFRLGVAPYAGDFARRAVDELERAMRLRPNLATLMMLMDAYGFVGDRDKLLASFSRVIELAPPLPLK